MGPPCGGASNSHTPTLARPLLDGPCTSHQANSRTKHTHLPFFTIYHSHAFTVATVPFPSTFLMTKHSQRPFAFGTAGVGETCTGLDSRDVRAGACVSLHAQWPSWPKPERMGDHAHGGALLALGIENATAAFCPPHVMERTLHGSSGCPMTSKLNEAYGELGCHTHHWGYMLRHGIRASVYVAFEIASEIALRLL